MNVPKLRFKEFEGNWEKRKIKNIGQVKSGYGFPDKFQGYKDLKYPFIKVSDMNIPGNEKEILKANNYVSDEIATEMKVKPLNGPAIVFAKVGGAVYLNRKRIVKGSFLIDNNMMALFPNDNAEFDFIYTYLQRINLAKYAQMGALPSYNAADIESISLSAPEKHEQSKIASFFTHIDRKIELQVNKVEMLKKQKKGLLQKIFSRKLRLKDENGEEFQEWKSVPLGDVATITMGQSPSSRAYSENPSNTILVQGNADLENGNILPRIYTSQITKMADEGDIIMSVRAPVGDVAISQYQVCIGRGVCAIKGDKFIYYYLYYFNESNGWAKFTQGSTFESINSSDIKSIVIPWPTQQERIIVNSFIENLQRKIQMEENKLDLLQVQKKGLMQQMFV